MCLRCLYDHPLAYHGKLPDSVVYPWGPCFVYVILVVESTGLQNHYYSLVYSFSAIASLVRIVETYNDFVLPEHI